MDGWIDGGSARNKKMNKRLRVRCRAGRVVGCVSDCKQISRGQTWTLEAWADARRRRHGKEPSCTNGRRDG